MKSKDVEFRHDWEFGLTIKATILPPLTATRFSPSEPPEVDKLKVYIGDIDITSEIDDDVAFDHFKEMALDEYRERGEER